MTAIGWVQILAFCAIIIVLTPAAGAYMTRVFNGDRTWLTPVLRPVERAIYWVGGIDADKEQGWLAYTVGMLLFHVGGFAILYVLLRLQPNLANAAVYACGSDAMIHGARDALLGAGLPERRFHSDAFVCSAATTFDQGR